MPETYTTNIVIRAQAVSYTHLDVYKRQPAEGEADDIRQLVEKFFEENPDVLNEIFVELEQGAANADGWEWLKEIVNPSGNRSFRKGLFFLMIDVYKRQGYSFYRENTLQ